MRVTRRSTAMRAPPIMESSRKRNNYTPIVAPCEGFHNQECVAQVSARLLTSCFLRMNREIWYSIAPNSDDTNDISNGLRQGWRYILPLLLHTGLLKKNEDERDEFTVMTKKWDTFVQERGGRWCYRHRWVRKECPQNWSGYKNIT